MGVPTERPADISGGVSGAPSGPDPRALGYARAAGASGLLFAVLFGFAFVLVRQAPGLDGSDATYTAFYSACTWFRSPGSPACGT